MSTILSTKNPPIPGGFFVGGIGFESNQGQEISLQRLIKNQLRYFRKCKLFRGYDKHSYHNPKLNLDLNQQPKTSSTNNQEICF